MNVRPWRWLAATTGGIVIALALALGLLRLALNRAPDYATQIAAWVHEQTDLTVRFSHLDARLRWFGPEIVLHEARVLDSDGAQTLFTTRAGTIGLDLLALFRSGQLVAGRIEFVEPHLAVERLADGRFHVVGLRMRAPDEPPFDLGRLPSGRVVVRDATLEYRDLGTGRGPWIVRDLDATLLRNGDRLDADGRAALPASLGNTLEFGLWLDGPLGTPRELAGRIEARLDGASVAGLAQLLPGQKVRATGGGGHVRVVATLEPGRLARARLDLDLRDLRADLPRRIAPPIETVEISKPRPSDTGNPLAMQVVDKRFVQRPAPALPRAIAYAVVSGTLRYADDGRHRTVNIERLQLQPRGGGAHAPVDAQFALEGQLSSRFDLTARAAAVDLASVWPLVQLAATRQAEPWLGLDPHGEIESLDVRLLRERAGSEPKFTVKASVRNLATQPVGRYPALSGLSARIAGDDRAGTMSISTAAASLTWPRLFREPLRVTSLTARGGWRREGRAWTFSADDVRVENEHLAAAGSIALTLEKGAESPLLELHASVDRGDASVVNQVLPVGRLRPPTVAWFANANLGGRVSHGRVDYRGPVRRFPFRNGEGEFRASGDLADGTVDYFPGFSPVTSGSGRIEFSNASVRVESRSARLAGLTVDRAEFSIADYKDPVIEVRGEVQGDANDALAYLQSSPLGPRLGHQFMEAQAQGPARYAVALSFPTQRPAERHYAVRVETQGANVTVPALRAPLQRLAGSFVVRDQSVRGESLRGTFLDGPVEFDLAPTAPSPGADIAIALRAKGRASGARLPPYLWMPEGVDGSGTVDYELAGRLERRGVGGPWTTSLDFNSTLAGLAIEAPAPFAKSAADLRRTRVRVDIPSNDRSELRIESGDARAALVFVENAERWRLERGQARFDGGPVELPAGAGLEVLGVWPNVDLSEWFALGSSSKPAQGQRLVDWLGPMDVQVDQLHLLGFEFANVAARVEPGARNWRIDVNGTQAAGRVVVPFELDGDEPLVMDMSRLTLLPARSSESGDRKRDVDPRKVPAIIARVDDFRWQTRQFGKLLADIRRVDGGVKLTKLATVGDAFTLDGDGSWLVAPGGGSRSQIAVTLQSTDFATSSVALGYRDSVEAERARIAANLSWPGGPSTDALRTMTGTIGLELDKGQLRSVEPGAGRMLGLLSVVELPRRLALDFRDITDEGFAFDTVRGDFTLKNGSAYTENLLLKGAAVDMGIVGRTGLVAEDYDQTLVVSGNPSGPLAVASTLAGGPVVGAGVLVLSQLFKGQLQGLTRLYYRVTGSWSEPVVERISAPAEASLVSGPPGAGGG